MADRAFLTVRNLDQLNAKLKKLPEKIGKKVVIGAMMKAAQVIQDEAIRLVPAKSGLLRSSIKKGAASTRGKEKPGEWHVRVGLARVKDSGYSASAKSSSKLKVVSLGGKTFITKKGWRPGPHVYGKWVQFGTKFMKARRFMETAARNKAQECVDILTDSLAEKIQEAARTL